MYRYVHVCIFLYVCVCMSYSGNQAFLRPIDKCHFIVVHKGVGVRHILANLIQAMDLFASIAEDSVIFAWFPYHFCLCDLPSPALFSLTSHSTVYIPPTQGLRSGGGG